MIKKTDFCGYERYTISSDSLRVSVITLGAICTEITFGGRNLALNLPTADAYLSDTAYTGAIVGRYANRIAGSKFPLNGREYQLTPNEKGNHLHGGPAAFDKKRWQAEILGDCAVKLRLFSPDGENGYPGNLSASVTYRVNGSELGLDLEGESDRDTLFAPTTHLYFNLGGGERILGTRLQIPADRYLLVDDALIPTRMQPVDGTPFDFRRMRPVGRSYDHCFVLSGSPACIVEDCGLRMTLHTDYPGLQVYTGDFLPGRPQAGIALEPEALPNSPNRPDFPGVVLRKGAHFHKYICYQFEQLSNESDTH